MSEAKRAGSAKDRADCWCASAEGSRAFAQVWRALRPQKLDELFPKHTRSMETYTAAKNDPDQLFLAAAQVIAEVASESMRISDKPAEPLSQKQKPLGDSRKYSSADLCLALYRGDLRLVEPPELQWFWRVRTMRLTNGAVCGFDTAVDAVLAQEFEPPPFLNRFKLLAKYFPDPSPFGPCSEDAFFRALIGVKAVMYEDPAMPGPAARFKLGGVAKDAPFHEVDEAFVAAVAEYKTMCAEVQARQISPHRPFDDQATLKLGSLAPREIVEREAARSAYRRSRDPRFPDQPKDLADAVFLAALSEAFANCQARRRSGGQNSAAATDACNFLAFAVVEAARRRHAMNPLTPLHSEGWA